MKVRRAAFVLALVPGCVLVDNPNYLELADEQSDAATGEASEGSLESTSETSETGDAGSSESTTGDACPPGTLGCPCEAAMCASELVCVDGVCALPMACPSEDPGVVVEFAPNESPDADTYLGFCELDLAAPGATLIGNLNCVLGLADFSFSISPYVPAEQPGGFLGNTMATVWMRIDPELGTFIHVSLESGPELWLVAASQLDSGDADVTNYPLPLAPADSDCAALPEPCGASQRRAIAAAEVVVFDGSVAAPVENVRLWVDEARSVCGVDSFRYALIAY